MALERAKKLCDTTLLSLSPTSLKSYKTPTFFKLHKTDANKKTWKEDPRKRLDIISFVALFLQPLLSFISRDKITCSVRPIPLTDSDADSRILPIPIPKYSIFFVQLLFRTFVLKGGNLVKKLMEKGTRSVPTGYYGCFTVDLNATFSQYFKKCLVLVLYQEEIPSSSFLFFLASATQRKATSSKPENQNKCNLIGIGNRPDSLEESVKPILSPIPWESADSDPMESVVH